MKLYIFHMDKSTNKETGEVSYFLKAIADVIEYGKLTKSEIVIRVDSLEGYKIGEADLNVVLPKVSYPYQLKK